MLTGCCPECTYSLQGLTIPRCPECGVALHPRLLVEPALAIPRPAWERRPRVSRRYAVARTFWDITRHPRRFFTSLQYADFLRHTILWYALVPLSGCLAMCAWILGRGVLRPASLPWATMLVFGTPAVAWKVLSNAVFPLAIIGLPLLIVTVFADLLLWRDRARFRLFAKIVLFSGTVQAFLVLALVAGGEILRVLAWLDWTTLWGWAIFNPGTPWSNVLIASIISWQFLLILVGLGRRRFAVLLPPRERARRALVVAVSAGWALSLHLALFDCLLGWRFITGIWGEGLG